MKCFMHKHCDLIFSHFETHLGITRTFCFIPGDIKGYINKVLQVRIRLINTKTIRNLHVKNITSSGSRLLGSMLILIMKNNEEELIYQIQRDE